MGTESQADNVACADFEEEKPEAGPSLKLEGSAMTIAKAHEEASLAMFVNKVGKDGKSSLVLKRGATNSCFPSKSHIDQ